MMLQMMSVVWPFSLEKKKKVMVEKTIQVRGWKVEEYLCSTENTETVTTKPGSESKEKSVKLLGTLLLQIQEKNMIK